MNEDMRRNKRHMDCERWIGNVFHEGLQRAQQLPGHFAVISDGVFDGLGQLLPDGPVAQTLMLAAAAKGIDSCPMEGFSAPEISAALGLPRGTVIPVVIALGYRTPNARIEHQWRRALADLVAEH